MDAERRRAVLDMSPLTEENYNYITLVLAARMIAGFLVFFGTLVPFGLIIVLALTIIAMAVAVFLHHESAPRYVAFFVAAFGFGAFNHALLVETIGFNKHFAQTIALFVFLSLAMQLLGSRIMARKMMHGFNLIGTPALAMAVCMFAITFQFLPVYILFIAFVAACATAVVSAATIQLLLYYTKSGYLTSIIEGVVLTCRFDLAVLAAHAYFKPMAAAMGGV